MDIKEYFNGPPKPGVSYKIGGRGSEDLMLNDRKNGKEMWNLNRAFLNIMTEKTRTYLDN